MCGILRDSRFAYSMKTKNHGDSFALVYNCLDDFANLLFPTDQSVNFA